MNYARQMNILNSVLTDLSEYPGFLDIYEFSANTRYSCFLFLKNETSIHCSGKVPKFYGRAKD